MTLFLLGSVTAASLIFGIAILAHAVDLRRQLEEATWPERKRLWLDGKGPVTANDVIKKRVTMDELAEHAVNSARNPANRALATEILRKAGDPFFQKPN